MIIAKGQLVSDDLGRDILGKCFANAAIEVIRMSAGLEVYEKKDSQGRNSLKAGRVSGMMLLCGQKNALLSITMSCDTAFTLVSYMTGTLTEDIKRDELWDGAAELVNMIAGRAKADLTGTEYHFSITPPFSIAGEDYSIVYKSRMPRIYRRLVSEEIEIFLEVAYI